MNESKQVAVRLEGVSKSFSKNRGLIGVLSVQPAVSWLFSEASRKQVFKDISFEVEAGSVFGILGCNGTGKTTLLQLIAGLHIPEQGSVQLFPGQPGSHAISMANPRELYIDFTPVEQLRVIARLNQLDEREALAGAARLASFLGVTETDFYETFQSNLSLGTKGKVALISGLLPLLAGNNAAGGLLILDEPTLGFDPFAKEDFFRAFHAFRAAFPQVTVLIGTNDPHEAALCDHCVSFVDGEIHKSAEALDQLQRATSRSREEIVAFCQLIDTNFEETAKEEEEHFVIHPIPTQVYSAWSVFSLRYLRDLARNKETTILLVLQLVLPNLLVLFSMTQARGFRDSFLVWVLGVYLTLHFRENMRLLDRERGYFGMLQTIWLSPISRFAHVRASTLVSWCSQTVYLVLAALVLLLLSFGQWNTEMLLADVSASDVFGVFCVLAGVLVASLAAGMITTYVPLALTHVQSYFFQAMIPFFGILCSGVYYETSELPLPLKIMSECNPLSYGAYAYRGFLGIENTSTPFLVEVLKQYFVNIEHEVLALGILLVTSVVFLLIAIYSFSSLERMMRRAGRYRV